MKHEIEFIISDGGEIEAKVTGIKGKACQQVSKWLDQIGKVLKREKTADYYKKEKALVKQRTGR